MYGGYCFVWFVEVINVYDVVMVFEGSIVLVLCVEDDYVCDSCNVCGM